MIYAIRCPIDEGKTIACDLAQVDDFADLSVARSPVLEALVVEVHPAALVTADAAGETLRSLARGHVVEELAEWPDPVTGDVARAYYAQRAGRCSDE